VAIGARFSGRALLAPPERFAVEHPQHGRIGGVVILHRARLARHEFVARFALGERNFRGARRGAGQHDSK
jgi:hypothetical protein